MSLVRAIEVKDMRRETWKTHKRFVYLHLAHRFAKGHCQSFNLRTGRIMPCDGHAWRANGKLKRLKGPFNCTICYSSKVLAYSRTPVRSSTPVSSLSKYLKMSSACCFLPDQMVRIQQQFFQRDPLVTRTTQSDEINK